VQSVKIVVGQNCRRSKIPSVKIAVGQNCCRSKLLSVKIAVGQTGRRSKLRRSKDLEPFQLMKNQKNHADELVVALLNLSNSYLLDKVEP
jgi:hypothetical protein